MSARAASPIKAWLAEFHLVRELYKGPNGKPLYTYQVTSSEIAKLRELLAGSRHNATHPLHGKVWAAGFCLFIAECYRREYDGSQGWSWVYFEKRLGCSFSPQQRSNIVASGLEGYWKRPIRQRERGRDLLGSLFFEGGLPWPLLQRKNNGFGRAVTMGLRHYYRTEGGHLTVSDLIGDYERYLPQSFQNLDTRQLLAGVVEQLMHLVEKYPIKGQADPASYLDASAPGWRSEFPIPLDQENARKLINDWLQDAGREAGRQERQNASALTCEHRLCGELPDWYMQTELVLPKETTIPVDTDQLSTTRLELGFFEGEKLVAWGGVVYGRLVEDLLKVRFPKTHIPLKRSDLSSTVSMRLLENGHVVYRFPFEASQLDCKKAPWIFDVNDDEWRVAASASCSLAADRVRIRIPNGFTVLEGKTKEIGRDSSGALWVEATDDVNLLGIDERYCIRLRQSVIRSAIPVLTGNFAQWESRPNTVYQGWPRLDIPDNCPYRQEELEQFANGQPLRALDLTNCTGVINYRLKTREGSTILQRGFGVLPKDIRLTLTPAVNGRPARVQVNSAQQLDLWVFDTDVRASRVNTHSGKELYLQHTGATHPATFILEIGVGSDIEPVQLSLPYPYQGARLVDVDGEPSEKQALLLDELLGMRLALFSGHTYDQRFKLKLKLESRSLQRLQRNYTIRVGQQPMMLNLFAYQNDMLQMFSAVDEQDATIQLSLQATEQLIDLTIRRYNGRVEWQDGSRIVISDMAGHQVLRDARVQAMLLSDPKKQPLQLEELTSEGVGTDCFILNSRMDQDGPWLIYPGEDSSVKFRPCFYPGGLCADASRGDVKSLHRATQLYHPIDNPTIIDDQIAAMARDFDHSGWQYLSDLKSEFSHLPLSTFESWLALSRNPAGLASAVLRLEMDETFCSRIRDELAVVWESIPLPLWVATYENFRTWLGEKGLPAALVNSLLDNRKSVLPEVVSGFEFVNDYLATGATENLTVAPVESVLPVWYQALRRRHFADDNWPTVLGPELRAWIDCNVLPASIKKLSMIGHTDAITYLPIFMAYVTAGEVVLDQLNVDTAHLKFAIRLLSDFDRHGWYTCVHSMMVSYLLAQSPTTNSDSSRRSSA
jgi:hypothetical protein